MTCIDRYKHKSRSTIHNDGTVTRSENFCSCPVFNMSLNNAKSSFKRDVHECQSYNALWNPTKIDIIDLSPKELLLTDVYNFKFDIFTHDYGLYNLKSSKSSCLIRRVSTPAKSTDYIFQKYSPKVEWFFIYDDVDKVSTTSSTDTYTIANHNYAEEENAIINVDHTFETYSVENSMKQRTLRKESDQKLIFKFSDNVITDEHNDISVSNPVASNTILDLSKSVVKEIVTLLSCYEFSIENDDVPNQTSNCLLKTARSYCEEIMNSFRAAKFLARPITKTFASDYWDFTSVTTLRVMSTHDFRSESNIPLRRRCSRAKSETDQTDDIPIRQI